MSNICPCTFGSSVSHALNNLRKAKKLNENQAEETVRGTVLSRRVDTCYSLEKSDSSWAYFVTVRLEDGREVELNASEEDYGKLKEGTQVQLTRKGDQLVSFV